MIARIVFGIILVAFGALWTIKAHQIYEWFGPIGWAEQHLGTEGGSRLMYQLIGVAFCVIGFMLITNMLGGLIIGLVRLLFPALGQ